MVIRVATLGDVSLMGMISHLWRCLVDQEEIEGNDVYARSAEGAKVKLLSGYNISEIKVSLNSYGYFAKGYYCESGFGLGIKWEDWS